MTFGRTLALGAIILLVAVVIAGSPVRASDIEVKIDNFTFNPKQVTVKAGDTFTFATPGTYPYFCALHPQMTGTIVVEASAAK